jgi:tRNA1(Val) A37 N6-methylase TrmN6
MTAEVPSPTAPSAPSGPDRRALLRLFQASFSILFLELVLIRWVPSYMRLFGYFTNFVLLGSLLGAGIGILTHRGARLRLPSFPILLLVLVAIVLWKQYTLNLPSTEELFYGAAAHSTEENYWVIPLIFGLVLLVFVPLGKELGALLASLPPLVAYGVDIGGSLAGIAVFTTLSFLSLPPVFWFAVFLVVAWPLVAKRWRYVSIGAAALTLFLSWNASLQSWNAGKNEIWSPYYRITTQARTGGGSIISVNNIGHQEASPGRNREGFYHRAYELFGPSAFKRVLVIGAGSGTDISVALANGVEHVDAVEIDPRLQELGRKLHPDHPYDDPRVTVHIDDGRAFLRKSQERYDLIIFALTDSLRLTSSHAALRLESFLLTEESLRSARAHLSDRGLLVLYNYYRQDWSVQKLAAMSTAAFGTPPYVTVYGAWGRAAAIMNGPLLASLPPGEARPYQQPPAIAPPPHARIPALGSGLMPGNSTLKAASDDWPFFYLSKPGVSGIYLWAILVILIVAGVIGAAFTRASAIRRFDWHFFFLGAAFMLLETRSLVTFALLFGTTWMVNALVFFAILSSVLGAVLLNARLKLRRVGWLYAALFALLALNYAIPVRALLDIGSSTLRYLLASVFAFAPIFVANVVFSRSFRDTAEADSAFASNLFGIAVGGVVEYAALATGYQALLIPVMVFYAAALFFGRRLIAAKA